MAKELPFEDDGGIDKGDTEPAFLVDLDGFEGPLDLLLELGDEEVVLGARILAGFLDVTVDAGLVGHHVVRVAQAAADRVLDLVGRRETLGQLAQHRGPLVLSAEIGRAHV